MITVEHLVKQYGDFRAVDDLSFTVEKGEILGFLGPNGAGKSTTMNMLTGYLSSTSGKCSIDGIDILENPSEAKRLIGFLPEQPPLYYDMTTREYLSFIYDLKRCTLNRREHIDEIIDIMGLGEMEKRLINQLSKGFKQRVGIAGALVSNPKILIFDEPTIGLDPRQIIEIRDLIRTLSKDHTIILSTHILPEVQAVCDRILIIDRGRLIADEKTENINSLAAENRKFTIRILGPKGEVSTFLRKTEGAAKVEFLSSGSDGSSLFMVQCKKGFDLRRTLFYALAEKRWPILELSNVGASLEDVFIALTK